MKMMLVATASAVALMVGMSPTNAALMISESLNGATFTCVDNTSCDTNAAVGIIDTGTTTLNGVVLTGLRASSSGTTLRPGPDILNSGSTAVINTNATAATIIASIGDTNFLGPVQRFSLSASGTFQNAVGATITDRWFDDPANAQGGGSPSSAPGNLLSTFSYTATNIADSFSNNLNNQLLAFPDSGLFSMTQQFTFTLPGAPAGCSLTSLAFCPQLVSRGQTEIKTPSAAPEPASLGLLGAGLLALGLARRRR